MTRTSRPAALALAAATAFAASSTASADVTLINAFEVEPDRLEAAVAAWRDARDFLAAEPGYRSTALYRALAPDARFALVNVATWESAEAFGRAAERMRAAGVFPPLEGVAMTPSLYAPIESDADPDDAR